jgi:hypothetical protein
MQPNKSAGAIKYQDLISHVSGRPGAMNVMLSLHEKLKLNWVGSQKKHLKQGCEKPWNGTCLIMFGGRLY